MTAQVYKQTATKDIKSSANAVYAFGREENMHGQPKENGGYAVFVLRDRFVGRDGDLQRKWALVGKNLSFEAAVNLLNERVHHVAYAA
jgi:hypothetical protein